MNDSVESWIEKICLGDGRAIARAMSAAESGDPSGVPLLKALFYKSGRAYTIGITGAPGAGKSTLVAKLAAEYRQKKKRVGIIAVDPSSPFSGGAILGDRIRMQSLATDDGIYIRSMATRGRLGGLAPAAQDVAMILDAAGCDVVLIETVGVGQDEVEVARMADATVVMMVPGMGDDIQTFKAGVMEIADIFDVNKADQAGTDRIEHEINSMLSITPQKTGWTPPILKTVATTGEGIAELTETLEEFRVYSRENADGLNRRRENLRVRLLELLRQSLFDKVTQERFDATAVDHYVDEILAHRRDPHSIVEEIIEASGVHAAGKR